MIHVDLKDTNNTVVTRIAHNECYYAPTPGSSVLAAVGDINLSAQYNMNTNQLVITVTYSNQNLYTIPSSALSVWVYHITINGSTVLNESHSQNSTFTSTKTFTIAANFDGSTNSIVVGYDYYLAGMDWRTKTLHTDKIANTSIYNSNSWKTGFAWTKVNGQWKRGLMWKKINGQWKCGI